MSTKEEVSRRRYRRWRVKKFNGRVWTGYRYFDDDYGALKCHLKYFRDGFASSLNAQLVVGGPFANLGGNDCLLWINYSPRPLGEPRQYWEDLLIRAKQELGIVVRGQ